MRISIQATATLIALWGLAVGSGFCWLADYSSEPGTHGVIPQQLPHTINAIESPPGPPRARLLVFLHPQCPCSVATVRELARLAPVVRTRADIQVLFAHPDDADSGDSPTSLRQQAAAIPGVSIADDPDGQLASACGVQTSGHALLYDANGVLLFSGGLTAGRGHEGGTPSQSALTAQLSSPDPPAFVEYCAFGCPLRTDTTSNNGDTVVARP